MYQISLKGWTYELSKLQHGNHTLYTMTQLISQRIKLEKTIILMNPNPETIPVVQ